MRFAILADIHSNLTAFRAVLKDIERVGGVDEIWCLGDVVGYGPDPHECIALLQQYKHVCVAGNHDWAAIGKMDTSYFNPEAAAASDWTQKQITAEDREYIKSLPLTIVKEGFTLVHGSPREPIWEYILSASLAEENLTHFKTMYCLIGHSHVPLVFECDELHCSGIRLQPDTGLSLGMKRLMINPGSVGQPRDGNHRASYALYDNERATINLYRVEYNIKAVQARMEEFCLPKRLIDRLAHGM